MDNSQTTISTQNWHKIVQSLRSNSTYGPKWEKILQDFSDISYDEAKNLGKDYRHAAHAFIWSKNSSNLWGTQMIAWILMQMRFDGYIGFPGGIIDPTDDSWEDGLNRELKEEIDLDEKYFVNRNDYFFSSYNDTKKLVLHFYVKEVTEIEYIKIEKDSMNSHDYGTEVLGLIRPPLYQIDKPNRGFNIFIQNQFIGNAFLQLLRSINHLSILSPEDIIKFIDLC